MKCEGKGKLRQREATRRERKKRNTPCCYRQKARVMDKLRTGVFVLFVLVVPVSCSEVFFTDPVICYFLDGFLMVYCIVATALYFREKFSHTPAEEFNEEDKGAIYQELERPKDTDPYQELEPLKRKKKSGKKKKSQTTQPDKKDKDPYESLNPSSPPPPLSPK